MAYSTFTLTGKFTTPSGKAHGGAVTVTPNATIRDTTGKTVMSGAERVTLDADGAWSVILPCDSAGLNPSSGIGYRLGFAFYSVALPAVSFYATADLAGTTLDASQIVSTTVADVVTTTIVVGPQVDYDTDGTPYLV